jgi:hypothetical protein
MVRRLIPYIAAAMLSSSLSAAAQTIDNVCQSSAEYEEGVERVLGKWPNSVVDKVRNFSFVGEDLGGESAGFNAQNFFVHLVIEEGPVRETSIDHELGHLVYDQMGEASDQVTGPLLREIQELQELVGGLAPLRRENPRYRAIVERFSEVEIYPGYQKKEWTLFLRHLGRNDQTQCMREYLELGYLKAPKIRNDFLVLNGDIRKARKLLKEGIGSVEERASLETHIRDFERVKEDITSLFGRVDNALEESQDGECAGEEYRNINLEMEVMEEELFRVKKQGAEVEQILGKYGQKDSQLGLFGLASLIMAISEDPSKIENELFARTVASLMGLYYGGSTVATYQLDETTLRGLERIQVDGELIFEDRVRIYREGLIMHQRGKSSKRIGRKLLTQEPRYVRIECYPDKESYLDFVTN